MVEKMTVYRAFPNSSVFYCFTKFELIFIYRPLITAHEYLMCCERTVVGPKLPEDGFSKH